MAVDVYEEAGLVILRQALDEVLVQDFESECSELMTASIAGYDNFGDATGPDSPAPVDQRSYPTKTLEHAGYCAVKEVLSFFTAGDQDLLVINRQAPLSQQRFHQDGLIKPPIYIVHSSDGGALDYVLGARSAEEAEAAQDPKTVEVEAGDVVIQKQTQIYHRGRNRGTGYRHNGVIYNPRLHLKLS